LITDAARSQNDQLRSRQKRYVFMMAGRVGCLILGAVLVSIKPPLLPLWLSLCALGMVLLPWAAVLIANDRPPKDKASRPAPRPQPAQQALTPESADDLKHRTIDVEP
jgi:uncharacterized membrane protein YfcA